VDAEERVRALLERVREEGVLQSEIAELANLSKSTVSEILSRLEEAREIVRQKVSGKSYRVWLSKYSPQPVEGLLRVGILRASEYPRVLKACRRFECCVKVYDSSIELTKDLVHGYVDIAASPFITQAFFGVLMKNIRIVRKVALNGGGVVFSGAESEYWGCSEFSTMERNLRNYLKRRNMRGEVRFFKSPESMLRALNELRGLAIWEPYFSMLEKEKEPFSEVIGDYLCCTLAVNENFLKLNSDLFSEFLEEFDSARVGEEEAAELAKLMNFPLEIVRKSFKSYDFYPDQEFTEKDFEELRFGGIERIIGLH